MKSIIAGMFALVFGVPFMALGIVFGFVKRGFVLGVELAEGLLDD